MRITVDCAREKKNFFFSKFEPYFCKKMISRQISHQNNITRAAHDLNKPDNPADMSKLLWSCLSAVCQHAARTDTQNLCF